MKIFKNIRLFAVEKITLLYIVVTAIVVLFFRLDFDVTLKLLLNRLIIISIILILSFLNQVYTGWLITLLRNAFIGSLLVFWYPETYDINGSMPNMDHLLARCEEWIFSCQPAIEFSLKLPQFWIREMMYFCYFTFFPIIIFVGLYFYFKNLSFFRYYFLTVMGAFLTYYLIFILFPTTGPQFYFSAIGYDSAKQGIFPSIGNYFSTHPELICTEKARGFFQALVESTQKVGERPTAAFPSSHVGISSLIVLLIIRSKKRVLLCIVAPIVSVLIFSTVYIGAHYVIDVIAGLITAFCFYLLSNKIYKYFMVKQDDKLY